ncbi:DUF1902 domain-containing protein [Xanthomonas cucurbitae]|nr:DUF1902 domain-containing protein [Xanthomonas cucurbitae]
MRPSELILRCYAERDGALWMAVCLDLSLAAQADSFEEARRKLDEQILDYVKDALAGPDKQHAYYLLTRRKAPASEWLRYYAIKYVAKIARAFHCTARDVKPFREMLPVVPASC